MSRLTSAIPAITFALVAPLVALAAVHGRLDTRVASLPSAAVPDVDVSVGTVVLAAGIDAFTGVDIVIANTGTEPLTVQAVRTTGDAAGAFAVAGAFPNVIAPGMADTVRVALVTQVQGAYTATVITETDDPDEPAVSVPVEARRVERVHVNRASAGGDGASWSSAYSELSGALAFVDSLDGRTSVWVRGGTYRPVGDGRAATFVVREGVSLLGGFSGTETSTDRDPALNPTLLTGDIGTPGDSTDNAYNVVTVRAVEAADSALVDGVVVTDGVDDEQTLLAPDGGGLTCMDADLSVRRTAFEANYGLGGGGVGSLRCRVAMFDVSFRGNRSAYGAAGLDAGLGTIAVERATFERNRAESGPGGAYFNGATYILTDSRLTANETTGAGANVGGGGLRVAAGSGRVARVVFERNRAQSGGGAFVTASAAATSRFEDVTFERNTATFGGGGLWIDGRVRLRAERVRFTANSAGSGGGIGVAGASRSLSRCDLVDTLFEDNIGANDGGAVRISSATAIVTRARFVRNRAADGGALSVFASTLYLASSEVYGNSAVNGTSDGSGGAVVTFGDASVTVVNSAFVGNRAQRSGSVLLALEGASRLVNVSVAANGPRAFSAQAGAPFPATIAVSNAVVWPVQAPLFAAFNPGTPGSGGTLSVDHALVQGGAAGTAVVDADPRYMRSPSPGPDGVWGTADDDYGDLRVQVGSPAVDAGLASQLPPDTADLDGDGDTAEPVPTALGGDPRVRGTAVDLGAYESPGAVASEEILASRRGLHVAGPNPTRGRTTVALYMDALDERVVVAVYDALGRQVAVLHDGPVETGKLGLTVDTSRLAAGVYVVQANTEAALWSTRLTVIR